MPSPLQSPSRALADSVADAQQPWAGFLAANANLSESSKSTYRAVWRRFLAFCQSRRTKPARATPALIEDFLRHGIVPKRGQAEPHPNTQRRYLELLSRIYATVPNKGNPAAPLFSMFETVDRPAPEALTERQMTKLDKAIDAILAGESQARALRDRAVIYLVLASGMKCGEVIQLTEKQLVNIDRNPEIRLPDTKTLSGRSAPVAPMGREPLRQWLAYRRERGYTGQVVFPHSLTPGGDLFGETPPERPMHAATVYRLVRRALDMAGLSLAQLGPTVLRHSFAVRQLQGGTSPEHVQRWLGHRSPGTTARYEKLLAYPPGVKIF